MSNNSFFAVFCQVDSNGQGNYTTAFNKACQQVPPDHTLEGSNIWNTSEHTFEHVDFGACETEGLTRNVISYKIQATSAFMAIALFQDGAQANKFANTYHSSYSGIEYPSVKIVPGVRVQ